MLHRNVAIASLLGGFCGGVVLGLASPGMKPYAMIWAILCCVCGVTVNMMRRR